MVGPCQVRELTTALLLRESSRSSTSAHAALLLRVSSALPLLLHLAAPPLVTSCAALVLQQECSSTLPLLVHVAVLVHDSSALLLRCMTRHLCSCCSTSMLPLLLLHSDSTLSTRAPPLPHYASTTFTSGITSGTRAAVYLCGKTARQLAPLLHSRQSASLLCSVHVCVMS